MILAVVQSSVILILTLLTCGVFRRHSAAMRHLILTAGLAGALLGPLVGPALPAWQPAAKIQVRPLNTLFSGEVAATGNESIRQSGLDFPATEAIRPERIAYVVWAVGSGIGTILLLGGFIRIGLIVLHGRPSTEHQWISAAGEVSRSLGLTRQVRLHQTASPVLGTWGVVRPRVFLPIDAANWSGDRLRVVLTHELAHIKRFDWTVQVLADIARIIYWFNPLFWIVCRRLRSESEHACDDVVLSVGIDARDYAGHLLDLARNLKDSGSRWSPVLAMAQPPHLERRFIAMLNPSLNHRSASRIAMVVVGVAAICVTLPLAAMRASQETPFPAVSSPKVAAVASTPVAKPIAFPRPAPSGTVAKPVLEPVRAQGLADGAISGTVSDSTGAVIPGVTVTVSSLVAQAQGRTEAPLTTATNAVGRFEFPALPAGQYALKAELPGFVSLRTDGIQVMASRTERRNITLAVAAVTQTLEVVTAGRPKPAAPAGVPRRVRVGGNVVAANLVSQVKPVYPQSAQDAGIEGTVLLQGVIGVDGTLIALSALNNIDPDLTRAALEAARQWRYRPTLLNNEPVEVLTTIQITFTLVE